MDGQGWVKLFRAPRSAEAVSVLEKGVPGNVWVNGNTVRFDVRAHSVGSVLLRF